MRGRSNQDPQLVVREIRRKTKRKFSSEEKIRIVLEGLKGEAVVVHIEIIGAFSGRKA